jgi:hypothetical protein
MTDRMMRRLAAGVALASTALAAPVASLAAVVPRALAPVAARVVQPAAKHILYRVRGPHGATMYLAGSVHLLAADAATLPPELDTAFAHAKTLVLEANLDSLTARAPELAARARLPAGQTLRGTLVPADVPKVDSLLRLYGLTIDQLNGFKPWFVSLVLAQLAAQRAHFQANLGVDEQLNARAKAAGKPVVGLESADFQLGLFDTLSPADQESMLVKSEAPDASVHALLAIEAAWTAGDAAALDSIAVSDTSMSPTVLATLVTDRNRSWIPKLEAMLQGHNDVLVVVGAAHLVGKDGVVALLRARGYTVEQL